MGEPQAKYVTEKETSFYCGPLQLVNRNYADLAIVSSSKSRLTRLHFLSLCVWSTKRHSFLPWHFFVSLLVVLAYQWMIH